MKIKKIIFIVLFIIIFCGLSILSFVFASGLYLGEQKLIFSIAALLFIISLLGMLMPKKIFNLWARFGKNVLSISTYYDDMIADNNQSYKIFQVINTVIAIISLVLLTILVIVDLL